MILEEKLKVFKDVTRNYQKYLEQIQGIDEKLELLQMKMENEHLADSDNEQQIPASGENPDIEIIEGKTLLETQKQHYLDLIAWIHKVIDSFDSPSIKALIWMSYIQRKSLSSIADEYLISKDNLYKIRRKHLNRILTDDTMRNLDEIKNKLSTDNRMVF